MIIFFKVWSVDSSRKRQQSKNWGAITTTWKTIPTCWGSLIPSSQIVKVKTCVVPSQLLSLPIRAKKVKKQNKTNKKPVIDHVAAILTNIKFYCKKKWLSGWNSNILSQANGNSCQPNPSKQKLLRSRRRLLPSVWKPRM